MSSRRWKILHLRKTRLQFGAPVIEVMTGARCARPLRRVIAASTSASVTDTASAIASAVSVRQVCFGKHELDGDRNQDYLQGRCPSFPPYLQWKDYDSIAGVRLSADSSVDLPQPQWPKKISLLSRVSLSTISYASSSRMSSL